MKPKRHLIRAFHEGKIVAQASLPSSRIEAFHAFCAELIAGWPPEELTLAIDWQI
jgi:hypothetical protein